MAAELKQFFCYEWQNTNTIAKSLEVLEEELKIFKNTTIDKDISTKIWDDVTLALKKYLRLDIEDDLSTLANESVKESGYLQAYICLVALSNNSLRAFNL